VFNNPSLAHVREFCEDRARVLAVISLPQETFYSSGASVKASLLFLGKFAEEEALTSHQSEAANVEVAAKYVGEIARKRRLEAAIMAAKETKNPDARKAAQRELADYRKRMQETQTLEARMLLKEKFDYPIFMKRRKSVSPLR
jgi:type I restriction enzyme M protein